METSIQTNNQRAATVWCSGGAKYDQKSRAIAISDSDSIAHGVLRLAPKPGERILDLATGTGLTSRLVARQGDQVSGVAIRIRPDRCSQGTKLC